MEAQAQAQYRANNDWLEWRLNLARLQLVPVQSREEGVSLDVLVATGTRAKTSLGLLGHELHNDNHESNQHCIGVYIHTTSTSTHYISVHTQPLHITVY